MSPITIIKALDSAQQGAEIYSMRGKIEITKSRYNQEKKKSTPYGKLFFRASSWPRKPAC